MEEKEVLSGALAKAELGRVTARAALADLVAAARNAKGLLDNYLKYQEKGCLHRPEVLKTVDEVAAKVNKANELL